jgi:Cdc6-like AAA superfamily ATPase
MNFKAPFTCIVVGATGSGKTQLVKKLISHRTESRHFWQFSNKYIHY